MSKLFYKFQAFMAERYGTDRLNFAFLGLFFVLLLFNLLIENGVFSWICNVLCLAILALTLLRLFSKNISARRRENEFYMRLTSKARAFLRFQAKKFSERKSFVYKKCPECHSVLRLKREKGEHTVVCPKCSARFHIKVR